MKSVIVVGGSLAGLRCIQGLREGGFSGTITLIGDETHTPYDRPPLSKQLLSRKWEPEKISLADSAGLRALGVKAVLGHQARELDAAARRVTIDDGSSFESDAIVIATGATPRNIFGNGVVLRTIDDCLFLRTMIGAGKKVVVIGAGFIGSEVAATCRGLGCTVHVIEAMPTPLAPALGEAVGAACGSLHERFGVTLSLGVGVKALNERSVELEDGTLIDADVIVVGIGVIPNVGWLENSGLRIDNGVVCDDRLFAAEGIVAAGDVARWLWRHHGVDELVRIEHWEVASQMGLGAAKSLLGNANAPVFNPIPYFWSDQYDVRIQVLGRPSPSDEVTVVDGSLDEEKFVVLYGRGGRLSAVLGISRPRQVMAFRPLLERGASYKEALEFLSLS